METSLHLTLNGRRRGDLVPDNLLLVDYLRDVAGLTGTKIGCDGGECGACTVHVNGQAMKTCQLPVRDVAGAEIKTIEGLSPDGSDPVQLAWVMEQVPQCGYCQSGQIMAAAALLDSDEKPTDEAIDVAMSDNICRCGTYNAIRRAIHRAADIRAGITSTDGAGASGGDR